MIQPKQNGNFDFNIENGRIWQNEKAPWKEISQAILPNKAVTHSLLIPVTKDNFAELHSPLYYEADRDNVNFRQRYLESEDRTAYLVEIPKIIEKGIVRANAHFIEYNLIELTCSIRRGDMGDSDGFGVEPDTWIKGYLNYQGEFVSPFSLPDSPVNQNIKNWFVVEQNPVDAEGKVRTCPFETIECEYNMKGFFSAGIGKNFGLIDKKLNIVIPLEYKMIYAKTNQLVRVHLHNDLCGILDLDNHFIVPPVYEYLEPIEKGKFAGCFKAVINGRLGYIDRNNKAVSEFVLITKDNNPLWYRLKGSLE
jgi:hypothetical protein